MSAEVDPFPPAKLKQVIIKPIKNKIPQMILKERVFFITFLVLNGNLSRVSLCAIFIIPISIVLLILKTIITIKNN